MWPNYYSRRKRLSPAWDMNRIHREMGFRFGGTRGPLNKSFPAINAWTSDDGLLIHAELPGIDSENIDIAVKGRSLTLSGTRNSDSDSEDLRYYRRERKSGDFSRSLELPFEVDEDLVEANLSQGILEISIPRRPEELPKKILVQSK